MGAILVGAALSTGCATLAHGRWQKVAVTSEPTAASVLVDGSPVGTTPLVLMLKRRTPRIVLRIEKDGYRTEEIVLQRRITSWIGGDVASGIAFSTERLYRLSEWPLVLAAIVAETAGIDLLTGAVYEHPAPVRATLAPVDP